MKLYKLYQYNICFAVQQKKRIHNYDREKLLIS